MPAPAGSLPALPYLQPELGGATPEARKQRDRVKLAALFAKLFEDNRGYDELLEVRALKSLRICYR